LRLSRHDNLRPSDWDTALGYIAEIFTNIRNMRVPEALAFFGFETSDLGDGSEETNHEARLLD
jgi:hypothetical protein